MKLSPHIFRAYDIRGTYLEHFDAEGFYLAAKSYAQYLKQKHNLETIKVFVSSDGRTSHDDLFPAVLAGLKSEDCNITWGGILPTPINFFAMKTEGFDASLQISASHNPAPDNGLKLTDKSGSVCGDEIQKIREIAEHNLEKVEIPESFADFADFQETDCFGDYRKFIQKISTKISPKRIVIDAGNGVSGKFYPQVLRDAGHSVTELYCELDGNFPNHQPDPERPENTADCQDKVLEANADFGCCFDGDGDRVGIILGDGTLLSADKILFVLAAYYLHHCPNEKVVVDIMSSATLIDKIKELGADVIVSPTGHSFIEENMHKFSADFGGEQSGHFMFGKRHFDFLGHDDACFAMVQFLIAVEEMPELLIEITDNWPDLLEFSEKMVATDETKFQILDKFKAEMADIFPADKLNFDDGVRIDYGEGEWAIVRCSNTTPKIVARIEAATKESLDEKKDVLLNILEKVSI